MEAKKRGRGRPKKEQVSLPKPKGKRGRPKKLNRLEVFDIGTGEMTELQKPIEQAFINHLPRTSTFELNIHDGNENGKVQVDWKGNVNQGFARIQQFYLTNKEFRDIITEIITGALSLKAKLIAEELNSVV